MHLFMKSDESDHTRLENLYFCQQQLLTMSYFTGSDAKNEVKFRLHLPCCISMSGYIVDNHRENPLLWEMQTHAAGIQTHNATQTDTHMSI